MTFLWLSSWNIFRKLTIQFRVVNSWTSHLPFNLIITFQEEKWYSAALKEEVDKITKEKIELEEKTSFLEKVFGDDNDDTLRVFGSSEQCFSVNSYCGITPLFHPIWYICMLWFIYFSGLQVFGTSL